MDKHRVRITSDGTPIDVTVMDAETGRVLRGIRRVDWSAFVGGMPNAHIEIAFAEIDVEVGVTTFSVGGHRLTYEQWQQVEALIASFSAAAGDTGRE